MNDERRYSEDEVREIFERASSPADGRQGTPSSSEGLTLAELQSIGTEVGLSPEEIAAAARALDAPRAAPRPTLLGMPVRASRTTHLPRLPTDREWELLLVELRTTFAARGRDGSRGNLREWRNGNLFAYIEPLETGCQLRLGTLKSNALAVNGIGLVSVLAGLVSVATLAATNDLAGANALVPVAWGGAAAAAFGFNAIRLPRWARTREMQMERIIDRARILVSDDRAAGASPGEGAG